MLLIWITVYYLVGAFVGWYFGRMVKVQSLDCYPTLLPTKVPKVPMNPMNPVLAARFLRALNFAAMNPELADRIRSALWALNFAAMNPQSSKVYCHGSGYR